MKNARKEKNISLYYKMEIVDIMKYMTIAIRIWNLELFAIFPFIYITLTSLGMPPCWCCCRIQRKKLNQRREIGWITWYALGTLCISFVWACKPITFIRRLSFLHDMWCIHLFFTDTTPHPVLVSNIVSYTSKPFKTAFSLLAHTFTMIHTWCSLIVLQPVVWAQISFMNAF